MQVDLDSALLQNHVSDKHYLIEVGNCLDWFLTQLSLHLYNEIVHMCNDKILVQR